jgi:hypothetical protein
MQHIHDYALQRQANSTAPLSLGAEVLCVGAGAELKGSCLGEWRRVYHSEPDTSPAWVPQPHTKPPSQVLFSIRRPANMQRSRSDLLRRNN